jgi:DNA modification methylase
VLRTSLALKNVARLADSWKGGEMADVFRGRGGTAASASLPVPLYTTPLGEAYAGDALGLLRQPPAESIDLVLTSPPFALVRKKAYGNEDAEHYADWFLPFAAEVRRVLRPFGSFVVELGWAYQKGRPVRSLYNIETVLRLCKEQGWVFIQEFYWNNPSKLPTPVEWVARRRIRVKDTVSPLFWLAKVANPKADWTGVKPPGRDPRKGRSRTEGPVLASADIPAILLWNGPPFDAYPDLSTLDFVAVPTNVITLANTDSNSQYLRYCRAVGITAHPARFPARLPGFFIEGLTEPGDLVADIFAGANMTGAASEKLNRRWLAFELNRDYLAASAFHFLPQKNPSVAEATYRRLCAPQAVALSLGTEPGA